ncbi:helix-turn-helix domain-containing protein [Clostridium sp. BNL1100]|uniref:helix-turn-helix domain-containing protein n=1 Tax=Clostridium sp. BNL1100 TaxID=755731 RepID=UPI00024A7B83|nr:helix-turn-helix domain-containing protein [Clostridium sp. BNL1100]AEY65741.1 hypothetical protein Clo1100_1511 [Clostridium sp. BNL1100]
MGNSFRKKLMDNVITSAEAAEMLEVTKQAVNLYVKEGKIESLRNTPNGTLFFKPDIEAFKERIKKPAGVKKYKSDSGITVKSLKFFDENIGKLSEIAAVFIFFNDFDAILDGFFDVEEEFELNGLKRVVNPTCVIRDINGDEIWLAGVTCGYGGEGPRGTKTIFRSLGVGEDIIEKVSYHHVIKLFRDGSDWEVVCHGSRLNNVVSYFEPSAEIYYFANRLVLVETGFKRWDENPIVLLDKYGSFIPDPKEINIFETDKQAIEYGYFINEIVTARRTAYKMIITDQSGRQLWLNTHIDGKVSIGKQEKVINAIKYLGFDDIKEDGLPDKIKAWLKKDILKIPPQPLSLIK